MASKKKTEATKRANEIRVAKQKAKRAGVSLNPATKLPHTNSFLLNQKGRKR